MPTTTTHGFVKPSSNLEPADMYGVTTRAMDSVESVMCPAYTAVAYNGAWADYGSPYEETSYAIEGHRVFLRGMAKHATTSTTGTVFTLPVGYRPAKTRRWMISAAVGFALITIDNVGVVSIAAYYSSGTAASVCFDNVNFDTAA